jgi:hypothetical protein
MLQTIEKDPVLDIIYAHKCAPNLVEKWLELKELFTKNFKKRIYDWILFFKNIDSSKIKYFDSQTRSFFDDSVNVILKLALEEEWFSQTHQEFNLSKKFYHFVFNSGYLTHFQDENEAIYFLKTSIVYSYYYDIISVSIIKTTELLRFSSNVENQSIFFKTLFSRYPNACDIVLYQNLLFMSMNDMHLFLKIIHGKSVRKIDTIPLLYSKKQAHLLLHGLPNFLKIKGDFFKEGWYLTKLLTYNNNEQFFLDFYYGLKLEYKISTLFIHDFSYWLEVYLFFTQNEEELEKYNLNTIGNISIRDILDYLMYKKYTEQNVVFMKNRSLSKLCSTVQEWDFYSYKISTYPVENTSWMDLKTAEWTYEIANKKYSVNEICDATTLYQEAATLKHCVYLYLDACISKRIRIFSLKKLTKKKYERCITIELRGKNIIQARGKYNRVLNKEELFILNEWAENLGYKMLVLP